MQVPQQKRGKGREKERRKERERERKRNRQAGRVGGREEEVIRQTIEIGDRKCALVKIVYIVTQS